MDVDEGRTGIIESTLKRAVDVLTRAGLTKVVEALVRRIVGTDRHKRIDAHDRCDFVLDYSAHIYSLMYEYWTWSPINASWPHEVVGAEQHGFTRLAQTQTMTARKRTTFRNYNPSNSIAVIVLAGATKTVSDFSLDGDTMERGHTSTSLVHFHPPSDDQHSVSCSPI